MYSTPSPSTATAIGLPRRTRGWTAVSAGTAHPAARHRRDDAVRIDLANAIVPEGGDEQRAGAIDCDAGEGHPGARRRTAVATGDAAAVPATGVTMPCVSILRTRPSGEVYGAGQINGDSREVLPSATMSMLVMMLFLPTLRIRPNSSVM
jgi:hypothetical protein